MNSKHPTTLIPQAAMALLLLAGVAAAGCHPNAAPAPAQQSFSTPAAAAAALDHAVEVNDQGSLAQILGPSSQQVIASGDSAEDASDRAAFLAAYKQMNRLATNPDGTVTLFLGAENWPFPIPLVQHGQSWEFNTTAGQKEILDRRVGHNEYHAIDVCHALIQAQHDYQAQMHQYAQHFVSDAGTRDGLFWSNGRGVTADAAAGSPIGPLLAFASVEGAAKAQRTPTPFQGYYFRMVHGNAPGEYAFVAYPATYRDSGVMTFLVNQTGVVYQKDLGANSATAARAITGTMPDSSWQPIG